MSDGGGFGNVSNNPELGGGYSDPVAHGSSVGFGTVTSNPEIAGGVSNPAAYGNALTSSAVALPAVSSPSGGHQQSTDSGAMSSVGGGSSAGDAFSAATSGGATSSSGGGASNTQAYEQYSHSSFDSVHPHTQQALTDAGVSPSAFDTLVQATASAFSPITPAYAEGLLPNPPVQGKPGAFVDPFAYAGTGSIGKAASAYAGGPAPYPDAGTPYSQIERFSFPSGLGTPQVPAAAVNPAIDPETGYEPGSLGDHLVRIQQGAGNLVSGAASDIDTWLKNPNQVDAAVNAAGSAIGNLLTKRAQVSVSPRPDVPPSPYHEALPPPPGTPIDFSGAAATLRPVGADIPAEQSPDDSAQWPAIVAPDVVSGRPPATPVQPVSSAVVPTESGATTAVKGVVLPGLPVGSRPSLIPGAGSVPTGAVKTVTVTPDGQVVPPVPPVAQPTVNVPLPRPRPEPTALPGDVQMPNVNDPGQFTRVGPSTTSGFGEPPTNLLVPAAAAGVPTPQARPLTPNIVQGDRGENVRQLQQQLMNAGYSVGRTGADGIAGPKTIAAMQKMEKDVGITRMTNRAGPEVSRALEDIPSAVPQPISPTVAQRAALGRPEAPWYTSQPLAPIGGKRADAGNALTDQQTAMGVTIPRDAVASGVGQPGVQVAGNDQGIPYQDNQENVIPDTGLHGLPLSVNPPVVQMNDPVTGERKNYTFEQYMQTFPDADPIDFHQMANPINRLQDQGGGEGVPMSALPAQGVQVAGNDRVWAPTGSPPAFSHGDTSDADLSWRPGVHPDRSNSMGVYDRSNTDQYGWQTPEQILQNYPGLANSPGQYREMYDQGIDPAIRYNVAPDPSKATILQHVPSVDQVPMSSIQDGQYYLDPQTGTLRRANRRSGGQTAVG